MFINIEGISGVGKSTIVSLLADKLSATIVKTIPEEFNKLRHFIDNSKFLNIDTLNSRFCFFLSATFYCSDIIKKKQDFCKTIITESYFYRAIAYHKGMGATLNIDLPRDILIPCHNFYLVCNEKNRSIRRNNRKKRTNDWIELSEQKINYILEEYKKFYYCMHVIDTTDYTPREISNQIMTLLKKENAI